MYSDIWGPSRAQTLGGARYFMNIIDDLSRKVWIYLLKIKDEAFSVFKGWKKTVEKQNRKKVKGLRTDNGPDYVSMSSTLIARVKALSYT